MLKNPKVALRIAQLQAVTCNRIQRTREDAIKQCLDTSHEASMAHQYSAAVSALCEANRIAGFHVRRVEVSARITQRDGSLAEFTTDELREWVTERRVLAAKQHSLREPVTEDEYLEVADES